MEIAPVSHEEKTACGDGLVHESDARFVPDARPENIQRVAAAAIGIGSDSPDIVTRQGKYPVQEVAGTGVRAWHDRPDCAVPVFYQRLVDAGGGAQRWFLPSGLSLFRSTF